jgi:hypothetical protein
MCAVPSTLLPSIFCLGSQISEPNIFQPNSSRRGGGGGGDIMPLLKGHSHESAHLILFLVHPALNSRGGVFCPPKGMVSRDLGSLFVVSICGGE